MRYSISNTAEYGDYTSGPKVIGPQARQAMQQILSDIQDGSFAKAWILENQAGRPAFDAMRRRQHDTQIEAVGRDMRDMMTWLK